MDRDATKSRSLNLVVTGFLLACVALIGCGQAVYGRSGPMVSTQVLNYDTELIQGNVNIPVLQGLVNRQLQEELNEQFDREITRFVEEITAEAQAFSDEFEEELSHWLPFQVAVDYRVAYLDESLASIPVVYYGYTGGAHGFYYQVSTNVDLSRGKALTLADLFIEGYDYCQIIEDEVVLQIEANPTDYFEEEMAERGIRPDHDFYLTPEGVVIYYGLYEIAPYVSGIPEFTIPFAKLWDGLQPSVRVLVREK